VDVFSRAESVGRVRRHLPRLADTDAGRRRRMDDLPRAVAQASGLLAGTSMSVTTICRAGPDHAAQTTAEGTQTYYPVSLATESAAVDWQPSVAGGR
jgi:hypothetical protein